MKRHGEVGTTRRAYDMHGVKGASGLGISITRWRRWVWEGTWPIVVLLLLLLRDGDYRKATYLQFNF